MGCASATNLRNVSNGGDVAPDGGEVAVDERVDACLRVGGGDGPLGLIAGGILVEFRGGGCAFRQ